MSSSQPVILFLAQAIEQSTSFLTVSSLTTIRQKRGWLSSRHGSAISRSPSRHFIRPANLFFTLTAAFGTRQRGDHSRLLVIMTASGTTSSTGAQQALHSTRKSPQSKQPFNGPAFNNSLIPSYLSTTKPLSHLSSIRVFGAVKWRASTSAASSKIVCQKVLPPPSHCDTARLTWELKETNGPIVLQNLAPPSLRSFLPESSCLTTSTISPNA